MLRLLTAIPFMLPTVVVAAGFNAWLGPRGWLNTWLQNLLGLDSPPLVFMGTLGAILVAHVFYNATIIIRMVSTALNRLDPRLDQTAASLGASPQQDFPIGHPAPPATHITGWFPAGFYFRFHKLRGDPVAGGTAIFHAGSGNIQPGAHLAQPAACRLAIPHPTPVYPGIFDSLQPDDYPAIRAT